MWGAGVRCVCGRLCVSMMCCVKKKGRKKKEDLSLTHLSGEDHMMMYLPI